MKTLGRLSWLAGIIIVAAACDSSSTGPSERWESIAGSYSGVMTGISQGVAMEATFSMTFSQNQGSLGGSYAMQGVLTDGVNWADVQGTGAMSGTIQSGNNPSVNITIAPGFCPSRTARFSGTFDSANARLTLFGPVEVLDENCQIFRSYPTTVVLTR
jgi:hypothetical protein